MSKNTNLMARIIVNGIINIFICKLIIYVDICEMRYYFFIKIKLCNINIL